MPLHKNIGVSDIHIPYEWLYADQATREAASGFVSADVGKLARQSDDNSLWMLTAITPSWQAIGGAGSSSEAIRLYFNCRKGSSGIITKGSPVYLSGYNASGYIEVEEAQADNASTMPCLGIANEALTNGATGKVVASGDINGINTNSWEVKDALYVSETDAGELKNSKPIGAANGIQKVAVVARKHISLGVIEVFGAGRVNDIPNLTEGKFWIGGTDDVPEEKFFHDSNYQESNGETTTTDDIPTWTEKVKLTFTPIAVGNYEINFSALLSHEDAGTILHARMQLDDTTTKKQVSPSIGKKYSDNMWFPYSGNFILESLSAIEHEIDMDFASDTAGKTMYIKEAVITYRRIG